MNDPDFPDPLLEGILEQLRSIADSLRGIVDSERGVLKMTDVDRAKVYSVGRRRGPCAHSRIQLKEEKAKREKFYDLCRNVHF